MSPLAIVGCGVGLLLLGGSAFAVAVAVNTFAQNDPRWGGERLGFGSSSLGDGGCLLSLFTIASNALKGTRYTPPQVNELLKAAKAFDPGSSLLKVPEAAAALALRVTKRVRQELDRQGKIVATPTLQQIRDVVDGALKAGGVAVVHVAKLTDPSGPVGAHFILVRSREKDGTYTAADPAPGKIVHLTAELGGRVKWGTRTKVYKPVGAFGLVKG